MGLSWPLAISPAGLRGTGRTCPALTLCCPAQEPDTDLEVVLEKKGNMDEAHIDQVGRSREPGRRSTLGSEGHQAASTAHFHPHFLLGDPFNLSVGLRGPLVIQSPRLRLCSP